MREDIIRFFVKLFSKPVVNFPTEKGSISYSDMWTAINKNLEISNIYISDAKFCLTSVTEAKNYLDAQPRISYIPEAHDCDNFSFASMGYFSQGLYSFAYGIAWSGVHAFNFMIDSDRKFWIVEPQTNSFMSVEEAKKSGEVYFPIRFALL